MNYSCKSILFSWKLYTKSNLRYIGMLLFSSVWQSPASAFCLLSPLQAVYMFYALAIVCDDFFVPSLEKICEVSFRCCFPRCCFHSSSGEPWGGGDDVFTVVLQCCPCCVSCCSARHVCVDSAPCSSSQDRLSRCSRHSQCGGCCCLSFACLCRCLCRNTRP